MVMDSKKDGEKQGQGSNNPPEEKKKRTLLPLKGANKKGVSIFPHVPVPPVEENPTIEDFKLPPATGPKKPPG